MKSVIIMEEIGMYLIRRLMKGSIKRKMTLEEEIIRKFNEGFKDKQDFICFYRKVMNDRRLFKERKRLYNLPEYNALIETYEDIGPE